MFIVTWSLGVSMIGIYSIISPPGSLSYLGRIGFTVWGVTLFLFGLGAALAWLSNHRQAFVTAAFVIAGATAIHAITIIIAYGPSHAAIRLNLSPLIIVAYALRVGRRPIGQEIYEVVQRMRKDDLDG